MQASELKEYIFNNDLVEEILYSLGCGHIQTKNGYISASNPDGNNTSAINVYLNENLTCVDYTRTISKNKTSTDIFDLVCFFEQCTFAESLKWVCNVVGIDYYREPEELPESLQIIKMLNQMQSEKEDDIDTPLKPISENILKYYLALPNKMFEDDGISTDIQQEFEVGLDPQSNYITIPIRDSIGSLVGVKGRYYGKPNEQHVKYLYLERCNKSKLLYGLWQNRQYIKNSRYLYVVESEKAVQQLASAGIRNVVSTSGKCISKAQVELITRTGCAPIICFDQDVERDEIDNVANMFLESVDVYAIIDKEHILDAKQSPSDDLDKWKYLINNCVYRMR